MCRSKHCLIVVVVASLIGAVGFAEPAEAAPPRPISPSELQVYVVAPGDYLSGIAVRLGVKLNDLLKLNNLTLNSVIHPGNRLSVPSGGVVPASQTNAPPNGVASSVYVVAAGDYLYGIALRLRVSLDQLLTANNLNTSSLIYPGMKLSIPGSPSGSSNAPVAGPETGHQVYVVVSGDSLSGIAAKLKVKLTDLLAVNSLSTTSMIHPGSRLVVPSGGVLPTAATTAAPAATSAATAASTGASRIAPVLSFALAQQGKPYAFNTSGPESYDCSGLTMAAFAEIGISLPHYSGAQVRYGAAVDWAVSPIMPGDLVFLESYVGSGVINHVGIATSATQWVHAPRSGDVVRTGSIPMYRVVTVRRLVGD
jgi:peptidoglycan endopeptidase LytE